MIKYEECKPGEATHFEVSGEWLAACGMGDVAKAMPIVRLQATLSPNTDFACMVHVTTDRGYPWVVAQGRGRYVRERVAAVPDDITPEELSALQAFAAAHGRRWKSELSMTYWYNARIWRDANGDTMHGSYLHGLRNRLGPTWLRSFRLPRAGV